MAGRSRASAKAAGTRFETSIGTYLHEHVSSFIERRRQGGSTDRGDLAGIRTVGGHRVVLEAKDYGGRMLAGPWCNEAELERGNDDALVGVVAVKRRGTTHPGDQFILMTVDDFAALLTGVRPPAA